jgi:hypothetical protein
MPEAFNQFFDFRSAKDQTIILSIAERFVADQLRASSILLADQLRGGRL